MKTLIICESTHHGNTRKLCDAIAAAEPDVDLLEVGRGPIPWEGYGRIGFASGVAFGKLYPAITEAAQSIPAGKEVFFLYTCGKTAGTFQNSSPRPSRPGAVRCWAVTAARASIPTGPLSSSAASTKTTPTGPSGTGRWRSTAD